MRHICYANMAFTACTVVVIASESHHIQFINMHLQQYDQMYSTLYTRDFWLIVS